MFKHFRNILLFTLLFAGPVMAQSIEGLKDIVSIQQEKILRMEDNIKKLVGSLEQQANFGTQNKSHSTKSRQLDGIRVYLYQRGFVEYQSLRLEISKRGIEVF